MNKVICCLTLICGVAGVAGARPAPHRHPHHHRPAPIHRPAPRPPKVGVHLDLAPWGSSFSVARVGKHGSVSLSVPLTPPPPVVVREEKTVVVQQAPVIIQTPSVAEKGVELNPLYVEKEQSAARTWVEGYWRVTRDPNGRELSRTWVAGHWE